MANNIVINVNISEAETHFQRLKITMNELKKNLRITFRLRNARFA